MIPDKFKFWIDARKKYHLSHAQIQMARKLGMNAKKFGSLANNDQEPWKKKDDQVRLNTIVYTTLEIVRKISFMLFPIIPESSLKALKIFNIKENQIELSSIQNHKYLEEGSSINKIDILFKKIEKNND